MKGKPISLAKARKARARTDKRAKADANAIKFARSPADRRREDAEAERREGHLDGHRRGGDTDGEA